MSYLYISLWKTFKTEEQIFERANGMTEMLWNQLTNDHMT